ncbi:MAG: hypothetical protein KDC24_03255 [Saprospiraceae bacterium]|nr:hypothetical protein [Saprospiraceae bacterium]
MNQMKILAALMLVLSIFLTACDKEDVLTNEDILVKNGWKVTSLIMTDEDGSYEAVNEMEACELDDIMLFEKEDNKFSRDQGASKCYEEEQQFETIGFWALSSNGEKLILSLIDDDAVNMDILEISETQIKLHWEESPEDDLLETCTLTLQPAN